MAAWTGTLPTTSDPKEGNQMKQFWSLLVGAALTAMFVPGAALAATVSVSAVAGTSFTTTGVDEAMNGAGMAGITVTACPLAGTCETKIWEAASGNNAVAGGATGTNWSLGLNGDSFDVNFVFSSGTGTWRSLSINTRGGLAAFDWIANPVLSPDSAAGLPFSLQLPDPISGSGIFDVEYSDVLYVGNAVYNDLYTIMTINFQDTGGFSGRMEFKADTDSIEDIAPRDPGTSVPTPATLALVGLGLVGVAVSRRKPSADA
jgi:hypothetical protein